MPAFTLPIQHNDWHGSLQNTTRRSVEPGSRKWFDGDVGQPDRRRPEGNMPVVVDDGLQRLPVLE